MIELGPGAGDATAAASCSTARRRASQRADGATARALARRDARRAHAARSRAAWLERARRAREQPARRRRRDPARRRVRGHRAERLGQEHARRRHRVPRARAPARRARRRAARRAHDAIDGASAVRARRARRSVAARPHLARQRRDLHQGLGLDRARSTRASPKRWRAASRRRHFSFNVDGGRCEACSGEGYETVEMQFLADVRLICPMLQGQALQGARCSRYGAAARASPSCSSRPSIEALELFRGERRDRARARPAREARPRLPPPRAAALHAVGRRGAAPEARARARRRARRRAARARRAERGPARRRGRTAARTRSTRSCRAAAACSSSSTTST